MAKKKQLTVQDTLINWQTIDKEDYISLTDMSNWDNDPNSRSRIQSWLKNGSTIRFLELWEQAYNPNFNYSHLTVIKNRISENAYVLSPKRWIEETGAIGIISKAGRYGGTFAHMDIAFEFATWLSPEFKFYLIKEFQRLKNEEQSLLDKEWNVNRFLTKRNYALQTEAVKQHLLPQANRELDEEWISYAEEADLLNVALFGITAKQWRTQNPQQAKKGENIRDHASNIQLIVLSNLEAINSELIREGMPKEERFFRMQQAAQFQIGIFYRDMPTLE